jgi:ABC-type nitrate/sulfonate/bicarbonate transport system substrate-binding protein
MHPFLRSRILQSVRLFLVGVTLLVFASCKREARELRVGYLPLIASLPPFIALEKNAYSSNGVTAHKRSPAAMT